MARQKFTLAVAPTFKSKVLIPVPGQAPEPVEFTFKGRTRDQFAEFIESIKEGEAKDVDVILDICSGWELEDAFDAKNIETLTQNYLGAARAIIDKYLAELTTARLGN
jgi:hypothetical protein